MDAPSQREREFAAHLLQQTEAEMVTLDLRFARGFIDTEPWRAAKEYHRGRRRALEQVVESGSQIPPWLWPSRPKRSMPSMLQIARYHGIEKCLPFCWKCRVTPRGENSWIRPWGLERAHVIDRFAGGLDSEPNLRPLCLSCHEYQPIFEPGQEDEALAWFNTRSNPGLDALRRRHGIAGA